MTAPPQTQQQQDSQKQNSNERKANGQDSHPLAWLAAWLVLNHQAEQRAIAAGVVTRLAPLWKILDFHDLKTSQVPWIQATLPVVEEAYKASQRAAQQFVIDYRHANLPAAPELTALTGTPATTTTESAAAQQAAADFQAHLAAALGGTPSPPSTPGTAAASPENVVPEASPVPEARRAVPKVIEDTPFQTTESTASLLGTGPGEVKKQMPAPEEQAMDAGRVLSSKVAIRIAIDGGRAVVRRAVDLDHEAVGWARVLNVDPCYFCAMLASRGAVYKHTSFTGSNNLFEGEGVAKVHDACRCGLRPVYSHSDTRDPTSEALWEQWKQHSQGLPSKEAIKAFRKNYEVPDVPDAPRIDMHSLLVQRNELLKDGFSADSDQVRWIDQQIARFGAILGNTDVIASTGRAASPARAAKKTAESAADVARRQLPALEKLAESLIARGFSESSPQVQWNRKQIARLKAALK